MNLCSNGWSLRLLTIIIMVSAVFTLCFNQAIGKAQVSCNTSNCVMNNSLIKFVFNIGGQSDLYLWSDESSSYVLLDDGYVNYLTMYDGTAWTHFSSLSSACGDTVSVLINDESKAVLNCYANATGQGGAARFNVTRNYTLLDGVPYLLIDDLVDAESSTGAVSPELKWVMGTNYSFIYVPNLTMQYKAAGWLSGGDVDDYLSNGYVALWNNDTNLTGFIRFTNSTSDYGSNTLISLDGNGLFSYELNVFPSDTYPANLKTYQSFAIGGFSKLNLSYSGNLATDYEWDKWTELSDTPTDYIIFYDANEGTGSTLDSKDASDNDGTLNNGAWEQAKKNYGVHLDGSSGNITSTSNTGIMGNSARSISLWLKSDKTDYSAYADVIHIGNRATKQKFGLLINPTTDAYTLWLYGADTGTGVSVSTDWEHWVITYDGSYFRGFKNGELVATSSLITDVNTADSPLHIGNREDGTNEPFDGLVDQIYVFDRNLTQTEITSLYGQGLPDSLNNDFSSTNYGRSQNASFAESFANNSLRPFNYSITKYAMGGGNGSPYYYNTSFNYDSIIPNDFNINPNYLMVASDTVNSTFYNFNTDPTYILINEYGNSYLWLQDTSSNTLGYSDTSHALIGPCSYWGYDQSLSPVTLNFTLWDEDEPSTPVIGEVQLELNLLNDTNYYHDLKGNSTYLLCIYPSNGSELINSTIINGNTSNNYYNRKYFHQGTTLNNVVLATKLFLLSNLGSNDGDITFTVKYRDDTVISDAIIQLERLYVGSGVNNIIAMAGKTDVDGMATTYINYLSNDYSITVVKDGQELKHFLSRTFLTSDNPYVLYIDSLVSLPEYLAGTPLMVINYTDGIINMSINDLDTNLETTELDVYRQGHYNTTLICNKTITGVSGATFCNVTSYLLGNDFLTYKVWVTESSNRYLLTTGYFDLKDYDSYGGDAPLAMFLLTAVAALIGVAGGARVALIMTAIGLLFSSLLFMPSTFMVVMPVVALLIISVKLLGGSQ